LFYPQRERWQQVQQYHLLTPKVTPFIKTVFFGDSITGGWPLHEFFPSHGVLNRGIGGDTPYGLYSRFEDDVLIYQPQKVFMLIGINSIDDPIDMLTDCIKDVSFKIMERGIHLFLCSILPMRNMGQADRPGKQQKILQVNEHLQAWAENQKVQWIDYYSVLVDQNGELAESYAKPDGLHLTFEAYVRMAQIVEPCLI
jgi:lysophospholipase L1-like esterase